MKVSQLLLFGIFFMEFLCSSARQNEFNADEAINTWLKKQRGIIS
jgi:hypothetical protein